MEERGLVLEEKCELQRVSNKGQDEIGLLHFPMIPLRFLGVFPLLCLYVGALLCTGASLACTHPPCRDTLVAAPIQSISAAGTGARACEGHTGATSSGMGVSLLAVSDVPRRVEHRHSPPQVQPKVGETAASRDVLKSSVILKDYYIKRIFIKQTCYQSNECFNHWRVAPTQQPPLLQHVIRSFSALIQKYWQTGPLSPVFCPLPGPVLSAL